MGDELLHQPAILSRLAPIGKVHGLDEILTSR